LLVGGPELGQLLVAHPDIDVIAFTGSRTVGLDILRNAHTPHPGQQHVKQVVCEMGGKNAIIVDEDADLDEAISGIIASAFGYSGQKCSACSRVIAVGTVAERLLPRLIAATAALQWGDPSDPANDHGPLIDAVALRKALDYIAIGQQEAHMAWQGHVPAYAQSGWYCPPTIFSDVQPEHRIAREEVFAPILALLTAKDFSSAIQIANDCDYALTGGVYSRLPQHLALAEEQIRVGNLYLNRRTTGARVGVQPFGGIALSGTGIQAGGPDYLKQFMWMQTVSSNVLRRGFVPDSQ
jgi:RHH-type proline utilization regulon transcriptional repressor/proline dehydrogenase/delta 1-pyrroline-5-carboxylate dehydrogenase